MSDKLPYFAAGLALALLTVVSTLKSGSSSSADLHPHCPPAVAPTPEKALIQEAPPLPAGLATQALAKPGKNDFSRMPDGSVVPALAADAPKKIKLGVALFGYVGAEGASPRGRSRASALEAAIEAQTLAGESFRRAIAKADPGSNEDIGWIQRGVLEKRVEYEVFRLKSGEVAATPVETPRGFWVVRRVK
jgi:hypothetical protein